MRDKLMNSYALRGPLAALAAFLVVAFLVVPAFAASGKEAPHEIRDLVVVEKQGRLLAFLSLNGAFSPEVFEALHSGVTTRFTYEIALMRSRPIIYDLELSRQTIVHQVKYDTLKKAYTFGSQNGSEEKIEKVTKSRREMMDWMAEINGHAIEQVRDLNAKGRYYLQVRANLNSVDFAFPFNYMLSFLAKKTPWHASKTFSARGM
ncbi:DUF4390 domain-containing protein [Nitrospinota bacterium]